MAKIDERKESIRNQILIAAKTYSEELAGKTFMYVFGEEYFEILFATNRFSHLTGVASYLSAEDLYEKAKKRKLTTNQFYFDSKHKLSNAKKKLPCLIRLPELTTTMVCVIKEFATLTVTYKLGVTNLEFTLALTENLDLNGKKLNDWYVPQSLRVKDKAIENSNGGEIVDFIFAKNAGDTIYTELKFRDNDKRIPSCVQAKIDPNLYNQMEKEI